MAVASKNRDHPTAFIEQTALFGELARDARFRDAYLHALHGLHTAGARATLHEVVEGHMASRD